MSVIDQQPWAPRYPSTVDDLVLPDHANLVDLLRDASDRYGAATALSFADRTWSFAETHRNSHAFARLLLERGFARGDRLAIILPNRPEYVFAFFGTLIAGGIVVQVNHRYPAAEMRRILDDSGTSIVITTDEVTGRCAPDAPTFLGRELILVTTEPDAGGSGATGAVPFERVADFLAAGPVVADVEPSDVAVLQYTGGTTGGAKGVMLTHRNLAANVEQRFAVTYALFDIPQGATTINVLPMCHVYSLTCVMLSSIRCGLNQILLPEFNPVEMLAIIRDRSPYVFTGVPTMYMALNRTPGVEAAGLDRVGIYNSAGAGFPLEQIEQFEGRTGGRIIEGFGLSEASPSTHLNPLTDERRVGSIGIPLPLTDVRIVDKDGTDTVSLPVGEVGEMLIRGPQVMAGYWDQPEATAAALRDGWLCTGDLAHMDGDGYFYIDGRKKDMIISGGFNIYPAEVEQVLFRFPGVLEAAVVGEPDPYRGETVCAYLVTDSTRAVREAELDEYCRRFLAGYKVPRSYRFVPDLPRTPVGKIAKNKLAEIYKPH